MSPKQDDRVTVAPLLHADETSPLLASSIHERPPRPWLRSPRYVLNIILFVVVLASFAEAIIGSPEARILESVICYRYYEQEDPSKINTGRDVVGPGAIGGVDEKYCKTAAVQESLASLNGMRQLYDGLPALLLAIPFGWAADIPRFGRWPIVFLNLLQATLRAGWVQIVTWNWQVFDVSSIYYNTILCLLGGGDSVVTALFYVMVSDSSPPGTRAAAFLRLGATNLSAALFMPPISAWLMSVSPWIPSFVGLALYSIATIAFLFVPETLNLQHEVSAKEQDMLSPTRRTRPQPASYHSATASVPDAANLEDRWTKRLKSSVSFLTNDWRVVALIVPFTAHLLLASTSTLLLQYVSTRYELTFSKATLLVTVRTSVTFVLLFIALPYLTQAIMRRYKLSGQTKDLLLARISQVLIAVGWTLVAASPNTATVALSLAVASSGIGAVFLMRSLLTSLVPAQHIARVYTIMSMVDTVGMMAGGPLLAGLFSQGLSLGGGWIGLPFYFIGGLSALFAVLLFLVRLEEGTDSSEEHHT